MRNGNEYLDEGNVSVIFLIFLMFEKCWKYGKDLFTCFVDLEKAYDWLSNFGGFCRKMALMISFCMPISHSLVQTEILWLGRWQANKGFRVDGELHQGCVLSPFHLSFSLFT